MMQQFLLAFAPALVAGFVFGFRHGFPANTYQDICNEISEYIVHGVVAIYAFTLYSMLVLEILDPPESPADVAQIPIMVVLFVLNAVFSVLAAGVGWCIGLAALIAIGVAVL